ncbi:hypothetical protein EMPS_10531 [Entomortierella parvispora]|uniref:Uncharacterized protein n=1 Tax=Entomortierella parvispora TaxID=205924 RepID=A0A9P3M1F0_9FUNG|nr:hypothetical protein EMPS_10531 [Entomortierella parvispora]
MVSFSLVHLRVLRSRLQLLTVSAQVSSPHSCPRIHRLSSDGRSSTLSPSFCRRLSSSARASQGSSPSSPETSAPVPPLEGTRRIAGPAVEARRIARTTYGGRVETPKISKYRVDCNSPKVIKRKKKPAAVQEAGNPPGSAPDSASASGPEDEPAPAVKPTRNPSKTEILRAREIKAAEKAAEKAAKAAAKAAEKEAEKAAEMAAEMMAAAESRKSLTRTPSKATETLTKKSTMRLSGPHPSGMQSSAPSTPPAATVRKNSLAGLPRPPSFTEPPAEIGLDALMATLTNVPKESAPTTASRVFEREKANWPSQPPPKVGRTVYRTILDWSIHPTVQPGDFGSEQLTSPSSSSFRSLETPRRKPSLAVSSFVQSITNTEISPTKNTSSTTPTKADSGFTAAGTRSTRRIGFGALDEAEELERKGSTNSKSNSGRSNSRSSPKFDSKFDSKFDVRPNSRCNSNIDRPRSQEPRDLPRATNSKRHQETEHEVDSPKLESAASKRTTRPRRVGFDSLEEDSKAPPKSTIRKSNNRFLF